MLGDIKLEANEKLNIEIIFPLIQAQKQFFEEPSAKESKQDLEDLQGLLAQAILKQHWCLALLLASSPVPVSQEQIAILQTNKEKIITFENLNALTSFGHYAIPIQDFEVKGSNLNRLVCLKSELVTHFLNLFSKGPKSVEEKIYASIKKRSMDQDGKLVTKRKLIVNNLKKAAEIDAMTGTETAKEDTIYFGKLLESWLKKINKSKNSQYNPLDLILEVFALLVDKGFQYKNGIKTVQLRFDSSKVNQESKGEYHRHENETRFGLHFQIHFPDSGLLGIVIHEFIHLLCKLMYGDTSTPYKIELEKLVKSILEYIQTKNFIPDYQGIFIGFFTYQAEEYADEFFPRLCEFMILNHEHPADLFPAAIGLKMHYFFTRFLHDVAKFKFKLLEQQQHIPLGRLEMFEYFKNKDYKNFFQHVSPQNNRGYNFFPIHYSLESQFLHMALEKKFDLNEPNKLGVTPFRYYINCGHVDLAATLLEKLWKSKQLTTSFINQMDLNQQDEKGQTLLQAIKRLKNEELTKSVNQSMIFSTLHSQAL